MNNKNKFGVWGLGVVGKSVINYLINIDCQIQVTDRKEPTQEELTFLNKNNIKFVSEQNIIEFIEHNDYIIPSPGIDLRKYEKYSHKFISELDIFSQNWKKSAIAVTGTLGKTSVVHLLSTIFNFFNLNIATAGNIGIGNQDKNSYDWQSPLDIVNKQKEYTSVLLEVSSFQLERCKNFAPDIAIWTNLYPNHLDRHGSLENYFNAKFKLIENQNANQQAIVHWNLKDQISKKTNKKIIFFSENPINTEDLILRSQDILYTIESNFFVKYSNNKREILINKNTLPNVSFSANWLILIAICEILSLDINKLKNINFGLPAHRLARIAIINNIEFYNDSKSTIPQATLAAIDQLNNKNIHLFLGGVSKGVDRSAIIKKLKNKVSTVFCFGGEAELLYDSCKKSNITAFKFDTLKAAFDNCFLQAKSGDKILFSPAGASFDLFKNYQERGDQFTKLVLNLENQYKKNKSE